MGNSQRFGVLRHDGFRNLWVGQLISQFGDALHTIIFLWLALDITKNPAIVGYIAAIGALPYILFSPAAGVAADRYDCRKILILSDVLSALLVFGFVLLLVYNPTPSFLLIGAFSFALATVNVVAAPARNASIPRLVPETELLEANTLNSTSQNVMPLVGNGLAALVLKVIFQINSKLAYSLAFGFNGITFLISAFFMARLPKIQAEQSEEKTTVWVEIKEGAKYVAKHPVLGPSMLASLLINFFVAPFMPTYVVVAQYKYKGTPDLLAILEIGFFLGMLCGSLLLYRFPVKRVGMAFSIYLALAAITIIPMGYLESPWHFWIMNFLCGVCIPPATVPLNTLIQSQTPDKLQGRVNAASGMIAGLVMPLGMAISGLLLAWLKLEGTFIFIGVGLLLAHLVPLFSKEFRHAVLPQKEHPQNER